MTTELQENGTKISYSVRELLAEIKATLSTIDSKLDNKAEKMVVENIDKRLAVIETLRASEVVWGNQLIVEFRELQKAHGENKLAINTLQTNKKDKDTFNLLWIPVIVSGIVTLVITLLYTKVI